MEEIFLVSENSPKIFNACNEGYEKIIKCFVEHGADINKEDNGGKTPLFITNDKGHKNIMKYLIKHGAYINNLSKEIKCLKMINQY